MRRVISLWLPAFPTDRLSRSQRKRRVKPFVTVAVTQGGSRVAAVNGHAADAGIAPAMPLADARALAPGIEVAAADAQGDARALQTLAAWCRNFTPWTAPEPAGEGATGAGVWLDITGCAHLFGGEDALLADLTGRVNRMGYAAHAVIADTPGAAWAVARFAGPDAAIVPPGGTKSALARLPVAALRLPAGSVQGLSALGLRRVGDLYALPRAPLTARFGAIVANRLDRALGAIGEPVSPTVPVPAHRERIALAEPIATLDDIARGLDHLLARLCRRLADEHAGVRRLEFAIYRVDGGTVTLCAGTSRASRDAAHLARLFRERIDTVDLGEGIDALVLAAPSLEPLAPDQLTFAGSATAVADIGVATLTDRLTARLGEDAVLRPVLRESHIPERAAALVPAASAAVAAVADSPPGRGARPLRLFPQPLPVEAVAPVPDGPPILFRWRRVLHRIARAEGPERLAPEWWRTPLPVDTPLEPATRDYYRVEDESGRRYWLYREGLYPGTPQWFMHGVFA